MVFGKVQIYSVTKKNGNVTSRIANGTFEEFLCNGNAFITWSGGTANCSYPFKNYLKSNEHGFTHEIYKVVGAISNEATFVKENDEFDETGMNFLLRLSESKC